MLEYLFVKETYLATVLATLIAKDITIKLYSMNNKVGDKIIFTLKINEYKLFFSLDYD